MTEPRVDAELARAHGLSEQEYERLCQGLGREPSLTELGITSALWSEHCSYKSSRVYLREFPTSGPHVVQGPGENAGVVDVGNGWVAVFKMESHNHPSFIEPYQGAATGVGGILRDIFTMGARPIACMDSLRFGELDGAAHAVVGGRRGARHRRLRQLHGDPDGRRRDRLPHELQRQHSGQRVRARPRAPDRSLQGPRDRRRKPDPLRRLAHRARRHPRRHHGVGLVRRRERGEAPDSAGRRSRSPRRSCSRPASKRCAAAPSSRSRTWARRVSRSSSFEMASRGGTGIRLDLDRVPLREPGLSPYEIMLSESQERMVVVAQRGREEELARVFRRWGLEVATIGEVTNSRRGEIRMHGSVAADLPIALMTDDAPVYQPAGRRAVRSVSAAGPAGSAAPSDRCPEHSLGFSRTPELASKEWIWRQYDHTVRTNTVAGSGRRRRGDPAQGDAGRVSAMTSDCQSGLLLPRSAPGRRRRRWRSRCATSRASVPSPWGSPTASTSAIPRTRRSPGSSRSASAECPKPAGRSACR